MFRLILCIRDQHNPWLLGLAALVCLIAISTALQLVAVGERGQTRTQAILLLLGGACGGAGAWATHFVAMLAYDPGMSTGYDPSETALSLLIAIIGGALGVAATARLPQPWKIPFWGLVFGLGVGAMHYVGTAALRVAGALSWSPIYVLASILIGALLAMSGLAIALRRRGLASFVGAALCTTLGVCCLHFIGMAGLTITADAAIHIPPSTVPHRWLAAGVGGLSIAITLAGLLTLWAYAVTQRSSLRLLRQIIEATPQAIGYFDAEDRFVLGNDAYRRELLELGVRAEPGVLYRKILQTAASSISVPQAAQPQWVDDRLQARSNAFSSYDQRMADGRFLRVQTSRTADGGVVNVISDITGLQRQADDLAAARDQSEAATRAKSTFLATMSHEIRTPLNGVLGMAQAMASGELNPEQAERLSVIRTSGQALLSILNDVLDISKIEAGKLQLEAVEFDLGETVRAAHAAFTAVAQAAGLGFPLEMAPRAEGIYRGDPMRLRQVLYNLLSNAIKFTEAGEVKLTVDVTEAGVSLVVADTGIGLTEAQAGALFEKFVQADASTTRRFGGTGLGLAICHELVELMSGDIAVDSRPGCGSAFAITVPLRRLRESAPFAPPVDAVDEEAPCDLRILAAEDNPTNQLVLKTLLAQAGIEPMIVANGAEAVEAWSNGRWDLILMDIQMPVMDGIQAARIIRARERDEHLGHTPIIALTANAMAHHVEEYAAVGMDAHVAKPIDLGKLFSTMEAVLDQDNTPAAAQTEAAA